MFGIGGQVKYLTYRRKTSPLQNNSAGLDDDNLYSFDKKV